MIYIPIWIDLKDTDKSRIYRENTDLHSNMDRFERFLSCFLVLAFSFIYIPIWIDLKEVSATTLDFKQKDLHSNMDRFESALPVSSAMSRSHLHSNMDRFES